LPDTTVVSPPRVALPPPLTSAKGVPAGRHRLASSRASRPHTARRCYPANG
jgi:hypothetical protein